MYATNSTSSYQLWNERSSHIHRRSQLHFPGICSVKQRQLSANHGLFLLKPYNEKHIKPADNKGLNVGNEIHQLASSGFGPPQGSNPVWDVFFTILLPFVQAIFCWGPSQILKQLGGLNPVDKAVETAERGAELVKDVANKVGDTAVETAEKGSKLVKDVADKVGDTAVGATDLGIKVVEDVAGKVEDRTEKNVELGTRAVKIVAGKVVDGTGQTIEVVENIGENVEGVADDIVEKLPVDGTLKDTVKGVEGIAKGATKDIRKIFGRGRL